MTRVLPKWPEFTVVEVPPRFMKLENQRALVAVTSVDDGPAISVAVPISSHLGDVPQAEIDHLIVVSVEAQLNKEAGE